MSDLYFKCFSLTPCSTKPLYCINKCNGNIVMTKKLCPLFLSLHRTEGPGQVFLITIQYLLQQLMDMPEEQWEDFIWSCDNMCNLDKLRVAKKPLPLPKPYDKIWLKVRKIVDRLQMRNHKNPECCLKYGSDDLKEKLPSSNNLAKTKQSGTGTTRLSAILLSWKELEVECPETR